MTEPHQWYYVAIERDPHDPVRENAVRTHQDALAWLAASAPVGSSRHNLQPMTSTIMGGGTVGTTYRLDGNGWGQYGLIVGPFGQEGSHYTYAPTPPEPRTPEPPRITEWPRGVDPTSALFDEPVVRLAVFLKKLADDQSGLEFNLKYWGPIAQKVLDSGLVTPDAVNALSEEHFA